MGRKRQSYSAEFKSKVVLEALREDKTLAELSSRYGVHANLITKWKKTVRDGVPALLGGKIESQDKASEEQMRRLYEEIGRLKMDLEFLKKRV